MGSRQSLDVFEKIVVYKTHLDTSWKQTHPVTLLLTWLA